MKKLAFLIVFYACSNFVNAAEIVMPRVNAKLFIHNPQTDLDLITVKDAGLKEKWVKLLFDNDKIDHFGSKAFDPNARFDAYYKNFGPFYRLADLNNDEVPELLFNGVVSDEDEREYVEIYTYQKNELVNIYKEIGHIMAYKIQPNTQEVLLYHHQYPCCGNASHNLNRLRLVEGKIQSLKRYFVGRDTDMKGKFFPDSTKVTADYKVASKKMELRWSGEVISKDAWYRRTPDNIIAHYEPGAVYNLLAEENGWYFVLVHAAPIKEASYVINADNFKETWIYGWVDKTKL